MQILVTGGAGFIGGHLAEHFAADGHDVVVLDNLDPYYSVDLKRHNIAVGREAGTDGDGSYEFVEGDVRDADLVEELVADAEYVFHEAAQAGVRTSVENPRKYDAVNVDGTLNVLDAARDHGIERVVVASSSSVYGGREEHLPFSETDPAMPVSPYGVSKLAAERYTCAYADVYDLPAVALRYFTVYGPRMRPNMAISNFVSRAINGDPPVVYGDGSQIRDFTYIEDIVTANEMLLSTDAADGEVLNIGSSGTIDIETLATEIRDQLAPGLDLAYADRHDADAEATHADISKATEVLGYEPTRSIREGVAEFIEWYQENREWYEPLVLES